MIKAFIIFEQDHITALVHTGQELYINSTMRCVQTNTAAVEKQYVLHILSVCL